MCVCVFVYAACIVHESGEEILSVIKFSLEDMLTCTEQYFVLPTTD